LSPANNKTSVEHLNMLAGARGVHSNTSARTRRALILFKDIIEQGDLPKRMLSLPDYVVLQDISTIEKEGLKEGIYVL
jgi:hypothetical protein